MRSMVEGIMGSPMREPFGGLVVLVAFIMTTLSVEGADKDRAVDEAKAIFQEIFKERVFNPNETKCQIRTEWADDPSPEYLRFRTFGFRANADRIAPEGQSFFRLFVKDLGQLCSDQEAVRYYDNELAKLSVGYSIHYQREFYSFPSFDKKFNKAIVLSGGYLGSRTLRQGGPKGNPVFGGDFIEVFVKEGGSWRLLRKIEHSVM